MVALTDLGKSLITVFDIAPFKNIHKKQKQLAMIMFGWTFQLISLWEKVEQWCWFLWIQGLFVCWKLIARVFSLPFDWFDGAKVNGLFHFRNFESGPRKPGYTKLPAPFSRRQIASLFKDLFHHVFVASGRIFTNSFCPPAFFLQLRADKDSKVHWHVLVT